MVPWRNILLVSSTPPTFFHRIIFCYRFFALLCLILTHFTTRSPQRIVYDRSRLTVYPRILTRYFYLTTIHITTTCPCFRCCSVLVFFVEHIL